MSEVPLYPEYTKWQSRELPQIHGIVHLRANVNARSFTPDVSTPGCKV
jgi:hypothetical protein